MKIRSILLVACIVVVPLIAMFSHRIPPPARAAVGRFLRDLGRDDVAATPAVVAAPAALPAGAAGAVEPAADVAVTAGVVPVAAVVPAAAPGSGTLERLRTLGAVAIDCRQLPGSGGHMATCRIPVDGAGQLERVFQAMGASAEAAIDNLLRDVAAWRNVSPGGPPRTMRF